MYANSVDPYQTAPGPCSHSMSRIETKPTKWLCAQRRLRVFAVCLKKARILSYPLSAQRRLWSDWVDAQADLSLPWRTCHFVGFGTMRLLFASQFGCHSVANHIVQKFRTITASFRGVRFCFCFLSLGFLRHSVLKAILTTILILFAFEIQ